MAKVPLVLVSTMPLAALDELTLVKTMASGVRLAALVPLISTATALGVLIVPSVVVIVPVLPLENNPLWPESGVMFSVAKVIAPALFCKLTPVPPDCVEVVFPKVTPFEAAAF